MKQTRPIIILFLVLSLLVTNTFAEERIYRSTRSEKSKWASVGGSSCCNCIFESIGKLPNDFPVTDVHSVRFPLLLSRSSSLHSNVKTDVIKLKLISGYTQFGFHLFEKIIEDDFNKNVFISPSSVAFALAMTYNGATGTTQEAMATVLGLKDLSLEEVNQANAAIKETLEDPDPNTQLNIANSLWAQKGTAFKPEFMNLNKDFYSAEVTVLDFADPKAPSIINDWVSRKTQGKINKIVDEIKSLAILYLINAIYFKGKWTDAFEAKETKKLPFTMMDGSQKKHPMMSRFGRYKYYQDENFQAISLPYGEKRISMCIFLPDKDSSLEELYKSLNPEKWESWMSRFEDAEGQIALPRFKLKFEKKLNEPLKSLGMAVAFDEKQANFGRMCQIPPNVYINEVKHKTFAEVNEEGTEAAAVTSVEMKKATAMPPPQKKFRMIVDRPFFFAIRDNQTGLILFMGSIVDPKLD